MIWHHRKETARRSQTGPGRVISNITTFLQFYPRLWTDGLLAHCKIVSLNFDVCEAPVPPGAYSESREGHRLAFANKREEKGREEGDEAKMKTGRRDRKK